MIRVGGFVIDKDMTECKLPDEVQTAWDKVYGDIRGCHRVPVLYCGKQVVSGTNYMIISKSNLVVLHSELSTWLELVVIHAPLPDSTTDTYHEVRTETLIDSLYIPGKAVGSGAAKPNPFVEYQYVFEAEYAVKFGVYVPSKLTNEVKIEHIYVIDGEVAQLNYANGMCLREGMGIVDLSGDFEQYPEVKQFTVDDYRVVAKGENGKYKCILWNDGKRSFSLEAPDGMTEAEIRDFIQSLALMDG